MTCLFCQIVAGKIPAQIVYQDDDVVAFKDINPQAPVHDIIVPRTHIKSIADATKEQAELIGRWLLAAPKVAAKEKIGKTGYRLVINYGADANLVVMHLHMHLLGGKKLRD
jgi:histidine triad (HIT) family protein